ncbi:hypothetical protein [Candidatus Contendibacter odensensis]|uniref:hypothetical protein n=1 Tax=Candidatus Contendibacter odensensis TaxID=1400860 RepID=UPI0018A9C81C|nr:hypothetical protein [Candidatus Contendobacter odensis]
MNNVSFLRCIGCAAHVGSEGGEVHGFSAHEGVTNAVRLRSDTPNISIRLHRIAIVRLFFIFF